MKNLLLVLCFVISNTILSQENFTGTWKSEKTDYTLVIFKL